MGRGGRGHTDPLVTKSGLTAVEAGGQKYLCTFSGTNGRESVTSVAKVVGLMGDRSAANVMARRFCDKGQNAFVGIGTDGQVYVAEELGPREAARVAEQISMERQRGIGKRTGDFARFQGVVGGSETIVVDHTTWAEGIALQYVDMPVDAIRINAVDQLPTVCGADQERRTAMITALGVVADMCDVGRATVIRRVAEELGQGTLRL